MVRPLFEGVFPAIITPFDSDGNVDSVALREVVRFQIDRGVDGFFVCGTMGEGVLMSVEQRKITAETVIGEAGGKASVIVHVGATNTAECIELAKHAEKIGADAVGVITPFFFKPDLEGLMTHYRLIAESIRIPVLAYNIPRLTGFNLTPETFRKLCAIENLHGIKDSSGNLSQLQEIIEAAPKPVTVINGADGIFLAALLIGAHAEISGVANAAPELLVELYENFKSGNYEKALELQRKINALRRILYSGPPVAPIKAALELRGVRAGLPKKPLRPLKPEEVSRLKDRLKSLNLFW